MSIIPYVVFDAFLDLISIAEDDMYCILSKESTDKRAAVVLMLTIWTRKLQISQLFMYTQQYRQLKNRSIWSAHLQNMIPLAIIIWYTQDNTC